MIHNDPFVSIHSLPLDLGTQRAAYNADAGQAQTAQGRRPIGEPPQQGKGHGEPESAPATRGSLTECAPPPT